MQFKLQVRDVAGDRVGIIDNRPLIVFKSPSWSTGNTAPRIRDCVGLSQALESFGRVRPGLEGVGIESSAESLATNMLKGV